MKKANYTLFQTHSWSSCFRTLTWAMVFAWCCLGVPEASAQEVVKMGFDTSTPLKNTCVTKTLDACGGTVDSEDIRFTDDGHNDGNYADPMGRNLAGPMANQPGRADTVEFCPVDQWHKVKVVFTDFDLENGDILNVYQGNKEAIRTTETTPGYETDPNSLVTRYAWYPIVFNPPGVIDSAATYLGAPVFASHLELNAMAIAPGSTHIRQVVDVPLAIPPSGTGTGTGVARAFGGWVDANCSPTDTEDADWNIIQGNPSGCLTFIFRTDGDNRKGSGWDAWVDCEDKGIELDPVAINSVYLECDEILATIPIIAPEVEACGEDQLSQSGLDKVAVKIYDHTNALVYDNHVSASFSSETWVGIGSFRVFYTLKADDAKTASARFAVQASPLVANDDLSIPFGEGCEIVLTPDDILESTCDPITDYMHYEITITLGEGPKAVIIPSDFTDINNVIYPSITKAKIEEAGMTVCDAVAKVTVKRVYYRNGDPLPEYEVSEFSESVTTTVTIKDITAPVINAPQSGTVTIIGCDTTGLDKIFADFGLSASDNCYDDIDVSYTVSMDDDPCLDINVLDNRTTKEVTVTFSATDDCGNATSIERDYILERPTEFARVGDVEVECEEDPEIPVPGLKIGYRNNSGEFVVKDTMDLEVEEYVCGYTFVFTDENIPTTDCGKKIYRTYEIIDWCQAGGGIIDSDVSYVEFTDKTPPVIQGEEENQVTPSDIIELDPHECIYDITKYAGPSATDNCSSVSVRLDSIFRIEDGQPWPVPHSLFTTLDCDSFKLKWIAEDGCHEQVATDTSYQLVEIKDVTPPSAVCTNGLTVSVPNDLGARVNLDEIDGGSEDACGIKSREIKRQDDDEDAWSDHVIITCEDVHEEVIIELRVTDNKDNVNTCWLTVTAEDKIPPVCGNLDDASITCKEIHTGELGASTDTDEDGQFDEDEWQPLTGDLMAAYNAHFGAPDCEDNLTCGELVIEQQYQLIELDCGALTAKRRYRANDWYPNSSSWGEQNIAVTYVPEWTLYFPADVDLTCADQNIPAPATAEDVIDNGSCDLWALEVTADTFEVGDGVCMKIERHYEVINWCVYNAGDDATVVAHDAAGTSVSVEGNEDKGRYTYTQVIKLYVTEAPVVTINDVITCIVGVGDAAPFSEEDNLLGAPAYECDTIRTFSASATNCVGTSLHDFEWKFYIEGALVDSGDGASFEQIVQPKVKYTVEFWAYDGCGNSKGESRDFEFWDCKKPTPYVLNGVAIDLGENGTVGVWATDLDQGSFDNCTDQSKLELYIATGEPVTGVDDIADIDGLSKVITLGCDNVGTQTVSIYVVDEEGNWDVVQTYVLVQNNQDVDCSNVTPEGMVAGLIVNPNGENVEQVAVSVSGSMEESYTTGTDGVFHFNLNPGGDYTVTPVKDMNPLNGVSTFDLVLISKHILGITPFDTPYKHIAADVNKSGTVTAFDMVQLRQLILNINTEFTNNDSWRFVDAKHDFAASTENPAAQDFAEFMDISELVANMMDVDFIGVKVGDINGNAAANSLLGAESRTMNGTLNFNVTDRFVEAGETVTVDFKSIDITAAQGYQFTMNFDGLTFNKLGEGVAKAGNFNTNIAKKGMITTSWDGEATADDVLFSLTFDANTSGLLSDLISVSSDLTPAEAYNTDGELLDVNIEFSTVAIAAGFELGQNSPNPFNEETVIGFNLPKAGSATLTVMNVQGKVLKEIKGDYAKGYNTIVLKAKELGATGLLHYQLESADQVATKKMIILD